jgi:hypothetical protein
MELALYIMVAAGYGYSVWLLWDQGRSNRGEMRSDQPASATRVMLGGNLAFPGARDETHLDQIHLSDAVH